MTLAEIANAIETNHGAIPEVAIRAFSEALGEPSHVVRSWLSFFECALSMRMKYLPDWRETVRNLSEEGNGNYVFETSITHPAFCGAIGRGETASRSQVVATLRAIEWHIEKNSSGGPRPTLTA